jgi:sulfur carrier protein ThiS
MQVHVNLFTGLDRYVSGYDLTRGLDWNLPEKARVRDLIQRLGIPLQAVTLIAVNGEVARGSARLSEGSRVDLFAAMGGG